MRRKLHDPLSGLLALEPSTNIIRDIVYQLLLFRQQEGSILCVEDPDPSMLFSIRDDRFQFERETLLITLRKKFSSINLNHCDSNLWKLHRSHQRFQDNLTDLLKRGFRGQSTPDLV